MKKNYLPPTVSSIEVNVCLPLAGSGPVKPKSTTNAAMKEAFYHSFFGVDLLNGTGGKWQFVEKRYNDSGNDVYNFKITNLHDPFFKEAQANVIGNSAANFTFYSKIPEWNHPFDVVFMIERNLIYGEGYTEDVSIKRNRDKINNKEWLEWEIDGVDIKIWWDMDDDRRYELNVWTSFALFDKIKHLLPVQYQVTQQDSTVPEPEVNEVVSREEFLKSFLGIDLTSEPDEKWTFEGIHPVSKYYKFRSDKLQDSPFKSCEVLAFKDGGANFLWQPVLFNMKKALNIAWQIERNLYGHHDMTYEDCVAKYKDKLLTVNSIDLRNEDEEYPASISYNTETDEMSMTLWTPINKNEIINKVDKTEPEKYLPRGEGEEELIPKEQFLANFFGVDLYNVPDGNWTFEGYDTTTKPRYIFKKNIDDPIFHLCELSAYPKGGSSFTWIGLKSESLETFKVASIIKRNLLEDETIVPAVCLTEYIDYVLGNADKIEIEIEDFSFQIFEDNSRGVVCLIMQTNINKDELIKRFVK